MKGPRAAGHLWPETFTRGAAMNARAAKCRWVALVACTWSLGWICAVAAATAADGDGPGARSAYLFSRAPIDFSWLRLEAARADGHVFARVSDALLTGGALQLPAGEVFGKIVKALNPRPASVAQSRLDCAVVNFVLDEGRLQDDAGIALESEDVRMVGGGIVDLATEGLWLAFGSAPRGGVNLALVNVASLVEIRGTLLAPQIAFNPTGVLREGAALGTSIVAFGRNTLGRALTGESAPDQAPCVAAAARRERARQR